MYRPAGEVNEVGGDFYDAFEIDGGWMVAIGDVMGRGRRRSLADRARTPHDPHRRPPDRQIRGWRRASSTRASSVSPELSAVQRDHPRAAQTPIEEPARISILVAGHPPPLLVARRDDRAVALQGPLLGAPDEHDWELSTLELRGRRPADPLHGRRDRGPRHRTNASARSDCATACRRPAGPRAAVARGRIRPRLVHRGRARGRRGGAGDHAIEGPAARVAKAGESAEEAIATDQRKLGWFRRPVKGYSVH